MIEITLITNNILVCNKYKTISPRHVTDVDVRFLHGTISHENGAAQDMNTVRYWKLMVRTHDFFGGSSNEAKNSWTGKFLVQMRH
jgi:hypothetical protein